MTELPADVTSFVEACSTSFNYLSINDLLQRVPRQELGELSQRLGIQGAPSPFKLIGHQATTVLELCLLHAPPFRDTKPNQLHDTRSRPPHGRRFRTCHNRPRLIAAIADGFFQYEVECAAQDRAWRETHRHALMARESLQRAVEVFLTLRARGLKPAIPSLRGVRRARLQSDLDDLTHLVEGLTPEAYRQADRPHPAETDVRQGDHPRPLLSMEDYRGILLGMENHVYRFGPSQFSNEGIYHVLAEDPHRVWSRGRWCDHGR